MKETTPMDGMAFPAAFLPSSSSNPNGQAGGVGLVGMAVEAGTGASRPRRIYSTPNSLLIEWVGQNQNTLFAGKLVAPKPIKSKNPSREKRKMRSFSPPPSKRNSRFHQICTHSHLPVGPMGTRLKGIVSRSLISTLE